MLVIRVQLLSYYYGKWNLVWYLDYIWICLRNKSKATCMQGRAGVLGICYMKLCSFHWCKLWSRNVETQGKTALQTIHSSGVSFPVQQNRFIKNMKQNIYGWQWISPFSKPNNPFLSLILRFHLPLSRFSSLIPWLLFLMSSLKMGLFSRVWQWPLRKEDESLLIHSSGLICES